MNTDKIPFPHKILKGQFALLSPLEDVSAVQLSISLQAFELDNEIHHLIIDATLNDVAVRLFARCGGFGFAFFASRKWLARRK
ncbi:hypothetical protein [Wielerella bovis]|uniref:hypothetical protein n=1 Tax=Wielerella bovis TaxID=2917790 RepID=UPI0020188EC7|nr:hypothetical protein [Wielerella bovis]ULJ60684.1 hypothetical protein MIS44_02085 [Wielerella bovis]